MAVRISRARMFSLLSAFVACLLAGYLVTLTPHLVHHLFDGDDAQPRCPLLVQSDHTPQLSTDPPSLTAVTAAAPLAVVADARVVIPTARSNRESRAPPAPASLA